MRHKGLLFVVAGIAMVVACRQSVAPVATPACALSADSLSFGAVRIGNSSDRSFTITNQGSTVLSGIVASSRAEFAIVGPPSYALDSGESESFTVRFTPTT